MSNRALGAFLIGLGLIVLALLFWGMGAQEAGGAAAGVGSVVCGVAALTP